MICEAIIKEKDTNNIIYNEESNYFLLLSCEISDDEESKVKISSNFSGEQLVLASDSILRYAYQKIQSEEKVSAKEASKIVLGMLEKIEDCFGSIEYEEEG